MYGTEKLSRPKTIGVDFDNTISGHPYLFVSVMEVFQHLGWNVIVVTYRQPDCFPEDLDFLVQKGFAVYFTDQIAKDKFMKNLGIDVDIWIDDEPETIVRNYNVPKGEFYD